MGTPDRAGGGVMKDYAERERPLPPPANVQASSAGVRVAKALFLAAIGAFVWLLVSHVVLANATLVERLCDEHRNCYERYCSQDMSCDAPEVPS